jgi:hypothetical protein
MKSFRLFFFAIALLGNAVFADYFIDLPTDVQEKANNPPPVFSYGGGFSVAYYLSTVDIGLDGTCRYRILKNHALNIFASIGLSEPVYELGMDWHWLFSDEDYFGIGVSGVIFEKEDSWENAPRISLSYGRDILPWKKAHFAFRTAVRLSYLIGESLGREEEYLTKTAQTVIHGSVSLLFF